MKRSKSWHALRKVKRSKSLRMLLMSLFWKHPLLRQKWVGVFFQLFSNVFRFPNFSGSALAPNLYGSSAHWGHWWLILYGCSLLLCWVRCNGSWCLTFKPRFSFQIYIYIYIYIYWVRRGSLPQPPLRSAAGREMQQRGWRGAASSSTSWRRSRPSSSGRRQDPFYFYCTRIFIYIYIYIYI